MLPVDRRINHLILGKNLPSSGVWIIAFLLDVEPKLLLAHRRSARLVMVSVARSGDRIAKDSRAAARKYYSRVRVLLFPFRDRFGCF